MARHPPKSKEKRPDDFDFAEYRRRVKTLEASRDISGLIGAVTEIPPSREPDQKARILALKALQRTRPPEAAAPLAKLLGDPDEAARAGAADALGLIGEREVLPLLVAALGDPHEGVRTRVVRALGRIGDPRATAPLINSLSDPSRYVRRQVAIALVSLGSVEALSAIEAASRQQRGLDRIRFHRAAAALRRKSTRV